MKKKMCRVTYDEFSKNENKYFKLAKKERIEITINGKVFMTLNKKTIEELKRNIKLLNSIKFILPPNVKFGKELDERN